MEEHAPQEIPPTAPPPSIIEVEAIPLSPAERAGPTIDAPPPPPPPEPPPFVDPVPPPKLRTTWREHAWAVLCHLMLFLAIPTVFLGGVITFFLWQIKGGKDPEVEDQGREALNFQINVAALTALLSITFFGMPLVPIVWLVAGIFCVIAARKASEGANYRYPWIWRVVTH
jgi:uncharacterized Tic20 family protein